MRRDMLLSNSRGIVPAINLGRPVKVVSRIVVCKQCFAKYELQETNGVFPEYTCKRKKCRQQLFFKDRGKIVAGRVLIFKDEAAYNSFEFKYLMPEEEEMDDSV